MLSVTQARAESWAAMSRGAASVVAKSTFDEKLGHHHGHKTDFAVKLLLITASHLTEFHPHQLKVSWSRSWQGKQRVCGGGGEGAKASRVVRRVKHVQLVEKV